MPDTNLTTPSPAHKPQRGEDSVGIPALKWLFREVVAYFGTPRNIARYYDVSNHRDPDEWAVVFRRWQDVLWHCTDRDLVAAWKYYRSHLDDFRGKAGQVYPPQPVTMDHCVYQVRQQQARTNRTRREEPERGQTSEEAMARFKAEWRRAMAEGAAIRDEKCRQWQRQNRQTRP